MTDIIQYLEWVVSGGLGRWLGSVLFVTATATAIATGLSTTLVAASNVVRNAIGK